MDKEFGDYNEQCLPHSNITNEKGFLDFDIYFLWYFNITTDTYRKLKYLRVSTLQLKVKFELRIY